MRRMLPLTCALLVGLSLTSSAQFRRGILADSTEITLYPVESPSVLLPKATLQIEVRNGSGATARALERVQERLARQLADNDSRLDIVAGSGALRLVATLTEWNESRRNSTKYVSETRQVGTREVTDKNGKKKTEPVYEYGRNRPSVVISATAGMRIEVRTAAGVLIADESTRHAINEEYLVDAGPPSRDEVQDLLIDGIVQRAAGRISPGRRPARVLLARSDAVDGLNSLAQNRRWTDWSSALDALPPHRDRKREAYRVHNQAVAHEALAYDAASVADARAHLERAASLLAQARALNGDEKYFGEAADRIARAVTGYGRLAALHEAATAVPAPAPPAARPVPAAAPPAAVEAAAMTNKDVIELRRAGLDDENLIAAITDAGAVQFDLSPAGLKALLTAKVSNKVIAAMRARAR
jgi:hypothetical protein